MRGTALITALWVGIPLLACDGAIGTPVTPLGRSSRDAPTPNPHPNPDPDPDPDPNPHLAPCDPSQHAGVTLEQIEVRFATEVHPQMLDAAAGCTACHHAASGRQLIVTSDARQTFYRAQAAGLLDDGPTSILSRLASTDPVIRMPRDLPAWSAEKIASVAAVVCALEAYQTTEQPDEIFPPDLTSPYTGPALAELDDTFINYPQLKGKVRAIFNDDWVRGGVDKFAENIGSFGGVDFTTRLVEARSATSDFLLGMDGLASDVCGRAATATSGPFTGLDLAQPLVDIPPSSNTRYQAENAAQMVPSTGAVSGSLYNLYANGTLSTTAPYPFPAQGQYRFTVAARGNLAGGVGPTMELRAGGEVLTTFTNIGTTLQTFTFTADRPAGPAIVAVAFTNDAVIGTEDRNLLVDYLNIEGPLGAGTGATRVTAARAAIGTLYRRILFRSPSSAETDAAYALLGDLVGMSLSLGSAWSGLCEALLKSPDFLFTLPPSRDDQSPEDQGRLLLLKVALDLVARPPTDPELADFAAGATLEAMIDRYLAMPEFRDYFFYKMRIRTESHGGDDADEPARMWTRLMMTGEPFSDVLVGDYTVTPSFDRAVRPAEHGQTGILTMKGFIETKPGLPHFNYAARVLSDFMGFVFEVPPEVIEQRRNATAASTVDPNSICYSCHRLLTPLAHQRLAWKDDGTYRTADDNGEPIDDTDRDLVADYPYKGQGIEAFATRAVKKESFIRTTLNMQYLLLLGRPMRHDQDERVIYRALWDRVQATRGDLRATLKLIMASPAYQGH